MRYRLHLSYDGTDFWGWQKQPTKKTIQGELERALFKLFKTEISAQGSGRTDAGVHALDQVVHFDYEGNTERFDLVRGINRHLPPSIVAREIYACPDDFHCLRDSVSKIYQYKVLSSPTRNPLKNRYAYWFSSPVNIEYLNEITKPLLGNHDFSAFQTSGTELKSTVRNIISAKWTRHELYEDEILFEIEGNGFLKQMVRNIVGTLLDGHWEERHTPASIAGILDSKDRQKAGSTAPAQGLSLFKVNYPESLDKKCRKL